MGDWLVSLLKATAPYQQKKSKRSANIGGRVILATRTQVNTLDETSRPTATLGTNYTILGADHHLLGWGETGDFRRLITFIILNLRLWRNASSAVPFLIAVEITPVPIPLVNSSTSPGLAPAFARTFFGCTTPVTEYPNLGRADIAAAGESHVLAANDA